MDTIRVNDIWLKFNIQFLHHRMTMRRYLIQKYQGLLRKHVQRNGEEAASSEFWALKGLTFTVSEGEIVGLLGHNGAGKSTLLMALAGIYSPNRGTIEVTGKVGTLLSLGAGFHEELTGRENIRLNAIFMGCTKQEIQSEMDRIVEFADLGRFIDAPLKTYSSGMRARLGFSIAVTINPDVLLIDEVFEAGDEAFKAKSGNLIEHYKQARRTIVMSSHNLAMLRRYCTRTILIDHGRLVADGPTDEIVAMYQSGQTPAPAAMA